LSTFTTAKLPTYELSFKSANEMSIDAAIHSAYSSAFPAADKKTF
jgi:hypothetical protein